MKKKILLLIAGFLLIIILFVGWKIFGPAVSISNGEYFYVRTGETISDVKQHLVEQHYIKGRSWYGLSSNLLKFKIAKAGRYKLKKGMSLFRLIKMLKNGSQSPVNFVITKLRTKEDLARKAGHSFEFDSLAMIQFLNNNDSLENYGLDSNTAMAAAMPYTYTLNWNTSPGKLFQKFNTAYKIFWTKEREQKATALNLKPTEICTIASIVEEETLKPEDKPLIASVYINRLQKNMPLQADPTVKFALRDFALKRILNVHLQKESPYNTYLHTGLPPGPICTPSLATIDAVLNAPQTDYIYFVANSNFDGSSVFTTNLADHQKYAKEYQKALNQRIDSLKKLNGK
jgi:UPF0755 protein